MSLKNCLIVFLISMVPIIELRGAIPYGVAFGLPLWLTYIIAIVGNMLPVPIIFFFARRVLEWGADKPYIGKLFTFFLEKGHRGGEKLKAKAGRGLYWALLLFVGIPLPGTGKVATAEQANEVGNAIRETLRAIYGARAARGVSILYGGSLSEKNAESLFAMPDVDGGLIGGASLEVEKLSGIIEAAQQELKGN